MTTKETLEWGWWKSHDSIPATLGHPRNYVLTQDELATYDALLQGLLDTAGREKAKTGVNYRAVRDGRIMAGQDSPRCTTLAHVLEFMLALGQHKLAVMSFLNEITKKRNEAREAEMRG